MGVLIPALISDWLRAASRRSLALPMCCGQAEYSLTNLEKGFGTEMCILAAGSWLEYTEWQELRKIGRSPKTATIVCPLHYSDLLLFHINPIHPVSASSMWWSVTMSKIKTRNRRISETSYNPCCCSWVWYYNEYSLFLSFSIHSGFASHLATLVVV